MLEQALQRYLEHINLSKYSILIINSSRKSILVTNMPAEWEQDFLSRKLDQTSEIVLMAKNKITPVIWASANIKNKEIQYLAEKYNIRNGVTFFMNIKSDRVILTLYFSEIETHFNERYRKEKKDILFQILTLFEKYYTKNIDYRLTTREDEIINLLKIGKTYSEIAMVIGVGERTVRFHIKNILEKMKVSSVRYAIFKAALDGVI
ncbi:TPA: LuxR C-terminal-related transcriptional regulator [Serratia fonticola]|uniref:helix-turn-helix transcriptional regulator n=1 Tax=Serratia fonticola TaxID=47917 RepID=UPI000FB2B22E|nr:LuxR family transcriptional regulator [Serratia fonticola]CAI1601917.1 Transcriptional activator protein luxR [Serratia fonticola]CAI2026579.1 Transcriptional activator protein luxR [Serratia fonticola]HBE9180745.1 autoinducer binding domain-containing protein [Serratia fonticola]